MVGVTKHFRTLEWDLTLFFQIGSGQKPILIYQLTVEDCDGYENNFQPLHAIFGGKSRHISLSDVSKAVHGIKISDANL